MQDSLFFVLEVFPHSEMITHTHTTGIFPYYITKTYLNTNLENMGQQPSVQWGN